MYYIVISYSCTCVFRGNVAERRQNRCDVSSCLAHLLRAEECHVEPCIAPAVVGRSASVGLFYGQPRTLRSVGCQRAGVGGACGADGLASSGNGPARAGVSWSCNNNSNNNNRVE